MKCPVWLWCTWEWLKKHWKWILLPVGLLLFLIGKLTAKKQIEVVSPALAAADAAKQAIDAQASEQRAAADAKEAGQLAGVDAAHAAAESAATGKILDTAAEAQGDSDRVNAVLHEVGKGMRQ
jgi:hypothetical protein